MTGFSQLVPSPLLTIWSKVRFTASALTAFSTCASAFVVFASESSTVRRRFPLGAAFAPFSTDAENTFVPDVLISSCVCLKIPLKCTLVSGIVKVKVDTSACGANVTPPLSVTPVN